MSFSPLRQVGLRGTDVQELSLDYRMSLGIGFLHLSLFF